MKQRTLIIGSPGTGKTTLAKEMVGNKKAVWLSEGDGFGKVEQDTEVIVFDEISTLEEVKRLITTDAIIQRKGKDYFEVEAEFIVISNTVKEDQIIHRERISIVNLDTKP